MKNLVIVLMLSVVFNVHASGTKQKCEIEFDKYCAKVEFIKKASRSYSSDFKVFFYKKNSSKNIFPSEEFSSYVWMKMDDGHSHGSSPVKIEQKKDHFLVTNVWFVMIGEWELHLELQKGKATKEKRTIKVQIGK